MTFLQSVVLGILWICLIPTKALDHMDVHIVTHTHDDTGWLVTVDDYYITIIQWIFETMVPTLKADNNRKFTYVEMAYLHRWWSEISDEKKQQVLDLVQSSQLQFNLAGWVMNDEANPTMSAEIRQMTDGAQFLLHNFGDVSRNFARAGWHIDPFGSSYVTAGMWSQIGFDIFGLNRINYQELANRKKNQNLEFVWKGSSSLGKESYIFVHILDSYYCSPKEIYWNGFDEIDTNTQVFADFVTNNQFHHYAYEEYNKSPWVVSNDHLPSFPPNIETIAEQFLADCRNRVSWYKHNHLLIPYGCDFAHTNLFMSYVQMDKLIQYVNSNPKYNTTIQYSTLYDYTKTINSLNLTWDLETNDFFNYVSASHNWWTGYFTSRPDLKAYARIAENTLRSAELLYTFSISISFPISISISAAAELDSAMGNISRLRFAEDVAQHHDALTGTETHFVNEDYKQMIHDSMSDVQLFMNKAAQQLLTAASRPMLEIQDSVVVTQQINSANCVAVVLQNPLAWTVTQLIQIRMNRSDIVVYDSNNRLVLSQINPLAEKNKSPFKPVAQVRLFFVAKQLAPLSFTTYFLKQSTNSVREPVHVGKLRIIEQENQRQQNIIVGNDDSSYLLQFDSDYSLLTKITNNKIGESLELTNSLEYYGSTGNQSGWVDNLPHDDPWRFRPSQDNRYQMTAGSNFEQVNIAYRQFVSFTGQELASIGWLIQPSNTNNANIYSAHVCDFNAQSFTYQYFGPKWSNQNFFVDWIIFENTLNNNPDVIDHYFDHKYRGSLLIENTQKDVVTVAIDLKQYQFSSKPYIITSVRKISCAEKASFFSTTISNITLTSVMVTIARTDKAQAWTARVYLDYVLFDSSSSSSKGVYNNKVEMFGIVPITLRSNIVHNAMNISLQPSNKDFIVNDPVVMVQIVQLNHLGLADVKQWRFTTTNNNLKYFTLHMQLENGDAAATAIEYQIIYWAFERITMKKRLDSKAITTKTRIYDGPLINEMQQFFQPNYTQSFYTISNPDNDLDLQYIANELYLGWIHDYTNFVSNFQLSPSPSPSPNFNSNNTLFVCQNSLEYIARTYDPYCDERVACNVWPTSSQSYLRNLADSLRFSTIVDRAHGTGSMGTGKYELFLQRRCASPRNNFPEGCLSPSNDTNPEIYILFDTAGNVSYLNRRLYLLQQSKPIQFFTLHNGDIANYINEYETSWTAINKTSVYKTGLPPNIHLLQLRYAYNDPNNEKENTGLLLQLWNMFELNENSQYSKPETIHLQSIFDANILDIRKVKEMQLTGVLPLDKLSRLVWNYKDEHGNVHVLDKDNIKDRQHRKQQLMQLKIDLTPRNIRTFVVN